jgi:hypothetical protein
LKACCYRQQDRTQLRNPRLCLGNDFYRQALSLDLRSNREYTDAILNAMGGMAKSQFSRIKALLQLSDEAVELADRYNLEEYRLRPVVGVASEYHSEIVRQIIDFNLTSKQIKDLCDGDGLNAEASDPLDKLLGSWNAVIVG